MTYPSYVNAGAFHLSSNEATATPGAPASIVAGNLLIAFVEVNQQGLTITTSTSGWVMGGSNGGANTSSFGWAYKVAVGSDTMPTFSWGGVNHDVTGQVIQITGNNGSGYVGDQIGAVSLTGGRANPATASGLTTAADGSTVFAIFSDQASNSISTPSGYSSCTANANADGSDAVWYANVATHGSTTTSLSITQTAYDFWFLLVEVKAYPQTPPTAYVNAGAQTSSSGSTSSTPAAPASIVAGNILVAYCEVNSSAPVGTVSTSTSGWTMGGHNVGANTSSYGWAYKIAAGGDTMPTFTWTGGASIDNTSQCFQFKGSGIGATALSGGRANPATASGITTTAAASTVFGLLTGGGNPTYAVPAGYNYCTATANADGSGELFGVYVPTSGTTTPSVSVPNPYDFWYLFIEIKPVAITGTIAQTLQNVTQASAGAVTTKGTVSQTLKPITQALAGAAEATGEVSQTLKLVTQAATGVEVVGANGAVLQTLKLVAQVASGAMWAKGTLSQTLKPITQAAIGHIGTGTYGTIAQALKLLKQSVASTSNSAPLTWDFTVNPTSLPPWMTFARASSGYRINSSGNYVSETTNAIRVDYTPGGGSIRGVLIEPETSNRLYQSHAFGTSPWILDLSTWTPNTTTGPDGAANSAGTLTPTAVSGYHDSENACSIATGRMVVIQAIVKANGYNYFSLGVASPSFAAESSIVIDLTTGVVSQKVLTGFTRNGMGSINLGDGWWYVWENVNLAAGNNMTIAFVAPTPNADGTTGTYTGNGSGAYVYEAMVECVKDATSIGSSYFPTTAAAAQRAPDFLTIAMQPGFSLVRYTFDNGSTQDVHVNAGINFITPVNLPGARRIAAVSQMVESSPVPAIFLDLNFAVDPDNLALLGVLFQQCEAGNCKLIGANDATAIPTGAPGLAAVFKNCGYGYVPVGAYQGGEGAFSSSYSAQIVSRFGTSGDTRSNYADAVTNLRTILAAQPDNSVTLMGCGFMTNIHGLLASAADGISPLTGAQLIAAKVAKFIVIGGVYPGPGAEYNFSINNESGTDAAYVVNNWPTGMTIIGIDYNFGINAGSWTQKPGDDLSNPFTYVYTLYNNWTHSWGPLAAMYASGAFASYFNVAGANGTNTINTSTGSNIWTATAGNFSYLGGAVSNAALLAEINLLAPPTAAQAAIGPITQILSRITQAITATQPFMGHIVQTLKRVTQATNGWMQPEGPIVMTLKSAKQMMNGWAEIVGGTVQVLPQMQQALTGAEITLTALYYATLNQLNLTRDAIERQIRSTFHGPPDDPLPPAT